MPTYEEIKEAKEGIYEINGYVKGDNIFTLLKTIFTHEAASEIMMKIFQEGIMNFKESNIKEIFAVDITHMNKPIPELLELEEEGITKSLEDIFEKIKENPDKVTITSEKPKYEMEYPEITRVKEEMTYEQLVEEKRKFFEDILVICDDCMNTMVYAGPAGSSLEYHCIERDCPTSRRNKVFLIHRNDYQEDKKKHDNK